MVSKVYFILLLCTINLEAYASTCGGIDIVSSFEGRPRTYGLLVSTVLHNITCGLYTPEMKCLRLEFQPMYVQYTYNYEDHVLSTVNTTLPAWTQPKGIADALCLGVIVY